jgi:predicted PurR-regulated permease PerM
MPEPRRDLTGIVLGVATVLGLAVASLWTLRPFLGAIIWATMIVIATWPLLLKAQKLFGGRRWAAVTVLCLGSLLLIAVPFTLAVGTIIDNVGVVTDWLTNVQTSGLPAAPGWLAKVPLMGERLTDGWNSLAQSGPNGISQQLEPYASKAFHWLTGIVGSVGGTLVQFLLMIGIAAVMYAKGETAVQGVTAFCTRLSGDRGAHIVKLAGQSIRGVALGVVVTALIQATLGGLGLLITGVPHVALLVLMIFMCCVIQIGPLFVLVPSVIWLYSNDHGTMGTILLIISIFTGTIDNVIRPILIKKGGADLSLLIIIPGVVGGLLSYGLLGIFIGPVVLAVTYTLLEAWVEKA